MQLESQWQFNHHQVIESIDAKLWQAFFGADNPFIQHAFLQALEASNVVSKATGWQPHHVSLYNGEQLIALMPLYIKHHSWGEYVFDWAWAEAYERHDIDYYPKLLTAVPFSPVQGSRIGLHGQLTQTQQRSIIELMTQHVIELCQQLGCSSWHGLFIKNVHQGQTAQLSPLIEQGTFGRLGTQFHWRNQQYRSFDDFLNALQSRKRKNIKKERAAIAEHNLEFEFVQGNEINALWPQFYQCYQNTYIKRSGHDGYLNQAFFELLGQTMLDNIRLLTVKNAQQQVVAMALYFVSDSHLYGRYWGTMQEIAGLHFEACYYQGIEYAIKHGLAIFDAGAQGEHKVIRGFEPQPMYSCHYIAHEAFADSIKHFCRQEQQHIKQYMQQLQLILPYKKQS